MHDALKPAIATWTQRVFASIDACIAPDATIDMQRLANTLAAASMWEGCPRAGDLSGESRDVSYRRIALGNHQTLGYEALLILWPPSHVTPVHDHDGLWGMECVLDGVLQVEAFDLSLDAHPHLVARDTTVLGIGDHVAFSDADYAHRCRNLSSNRSTLSLHIYGGELNQYRSFHIQEEGRWAVRTHDAVRDATLV
ncbi:MAG TPA: cysteine dioxygenase family protein [Dyella sp.]|uniref:cysteine dioxygenase n=1 Tax=Dyella sp. TaxID=1869338 RepID=UPI002BD3EE0B|nr:cysteine dioxygenase family protein [Dyella sp.]HTV84840.1 cysteine dioxygenase family protein [Dyella sp.]